MKLALALTAFAIVSSASSAFAADVCGKRIAHAPIPFTADIEYDYRHIGNTVTLSITEFSGAIVQMKMQEGLEKAVKGAKDADAVMNLIKTVTIDVGTVVKLELAGGVTKVDLNGKSQQFSDDLLPTVAKFIENEILAKKDRGSKFVPCS